MTDLKIGGEFDINPELLINRTEKFSPEGFLFSSGRIAFHAVLDFLKKNRNIDEILLPDYLCTSIIQAAQNNHFTISFYRLTKNLDLDRELFPKGIEDRAILIINYFGLKQPSDDIDFLQNNTHN